MRVRKIPLPLSPLSRQPTPLAAHHSFAAEFNDQKPIKVTGVVTKVEWQNPHVWFYVDVKDANGKVTNWGFAEARPAS